MEITENVPPPREQYSEGDVVKDYAMPTEDNQDGAIPHVHFFSTEPTINACPPLGHAGPPISQFFQWHSGGERQRYKDRDCVVDADGRLWIMLHGEWVAASGICDDK